MPSETVERWEERADEARHFLEAVFGHFKAPEQRRAAARGLVRFVAVFAMGGPDPDTLSLPAMNSYVGALLQAEGGVAAHYHCGKCALLWAALSRAGLPIVDGFETLLDHDAQVASLEGPGHADALASAIGKILDFRRRETQAPTS